MSGFYGVLSLTGQNAATEHLDKMDAVIAPWGTDAAGHWHTGPIALGSRLLRVTPEDAFDGQPVVAEDLVLVGHFRLDDRSALAHHLGLDSGDLAHLPDSQLFLRAWQRWGEGCVEYLYGDWACALWDRQRQSLWLGRDAAGNTGLYYWHNAQWLIFSNSLKALLAHPDVPKQPNAYHIAHQLTVVTDPTQAGAIAYADIFYLPVGEALRCDRSRVESPYRWWQPEQLPELDWTDEQDYDAAFRELYKAAVTDRLRRATGSVGLMLSAGLDSGSVAAWAAPHLVHQGDRLRGYVSVPYFPPDGASSKRMGDETTLAKATADHIGNIDFIPVSSQNSSIVASLETLLDIHQRPGHAASNYYWITDILRLAKDQGVSVLLTGQGGNATVSWTGVGNLWPDLLQGNWNEFSSAFRQSQVGTWVTFKRQMLKPMVQPSLNAVERLKTLGRSPWESYSAINPAWATQLKLDDRIRAVGESPFFSETFNPKSPRVTRFRLGRLGSVGENWMENGAAHQLDVRDPTRDRRLIEFCWRVPNRIFWANGLQRGLIRRGMAGALPHAVLHSQRKGLQAADVGYRVWVEREAISATLDQLEGNVLAREWLDLTKMRAVLAALEDGITPTKTQQVSSILLRGLGVGLFLTRF